MRSPWFSEWVSTFVTYCGTYEARLQRDGNFVIYLVSSAAQPIWATHTAGAGPNVWLGVQGDGNLVLYTPSPTRALWASESREAADVVLQNDGNLVRYGPGHREPGQSNELGKVTGALRSCGADLARCKPQSAPPFRPVQRSGNHNLRA